MLRLEAKILADLDAIGQTARRRAGSAQRSRKRGRRSDLERCCNAAFAASAVCTGVRRAYTLEQLRPINLAVVEHRVRVAVGRHREVALPTFAPISAHDSLSR